jgi:hypothetical protein
MANPNLQQKLPKSSAAPNSSTPWHGFVANAPSLTTLVSRKEAARMTGLSAQTLAHWASTGRENLPFIKLSTRVMYRVGDILDFIESKRVVPAEK